MRGLIALVTVMSLLIVAGLGLVAYGMVTRMAPDTVKEHAALVLPAGSQLRQVVGYKSGLALHVTQGGKNHLYFVNPSNGKITGHLPVTTAAP